jgi:hypothetical protein
VKCKSQTVKEVKGKICYLIARTGVYSVKDRVKLNKLRHAETQARENGVTISRLRAMPPEHFYEATASVDSGHRFVSSTARMLLAQRDRGGLQSATFHTLRTYLAPLHKLLKDWLRSFPDTGRMPFILQGAVEWLKGTNEREQRTPREAI